MKSWKLVTLVLAGAVVLGGCSLIPGQGPAANTTAPEATSQATGGNPLENMTNAVTVSYKDGAFLPSPVKVKAGQAVKFVNNGSSPLWIASNPHPTHTDYPGFDSSRGINPGENYIFVFNKVGTWGYHNHLAPGQKGTVEVTQ